MSCFYGFVEKRGVSQMASVSMTACDEYSFRFSRFLNYPTLMLSINFLHFNFQVFGMLNCNDCLTIMSRMPFQKNMGFCRQNRSLHLVRIKESRDHVNSENARFSVYIDYMLELNSHLIVGLKAWSEQV